MRNKNKLNLFLARHLDPHFAFLSRWAGLNSLSILNLIFLLIFTGAFNLIVFYSHWGCVIPAWGHILVGAIPVALLFLLLLITLKQNLRGTLPVLFCCLLTAICIGASGLYNNPITLMFEEGVSPPVTNTHYYSRMLRVSGYPHGGMEVFPKRIPADAAVAEMSYQPQFLQGIGRAELLVGYAPEDFTEALARVQETAVPADAAEYTYIPNVGHDFTEFITITSQWDYYLSMSKPSGSDGGWNHGLVCGAAVMERDHYILYFQHQW